MMLICSLLVDSSSKGRGLSCVHAWGGEAFIYVRGSRRSITSARGISQTKKKMACDGLSSGCVGGLGKKSSAFSAGGASRRSTRSVPEKRVECKKQVFSDTDSMENNPGNSNVHDSIPSGSSAVVNSDVHTAENNANSEFVNHGLIAWNEQRRAWVGDRSRRTHRVPREPVISWCSTYDDLLATNQPFEPPVPLSEMVDFLVDIWHEEGLYD